MKNFWVRTVSAIVYVLLFLGCIYAGTLTGNKAVGVIALACFLLFVACGCTFEFFRIVGKQGAMPNKPLGYLLTVVVVLILATLPLRSSVSGFLFMATVYICFAALFPLAAIVQLWHHSEQPMRDAAYTLVPMLYAAIPLGIMPWLHYDYNVLVMVLIMVWMNDNGAYMGGSIYGKHKMWTRHSPGKTWEGTITGVAVSLLVAYFVGPLFNPEIAWYHWLVLGLICSVVATLGDLVESMLKRSVGMKDSGRIMPGHGGFLDRFDSLLIVVPFVYVYLAFLM